MNEEMNQEFSECYNDGFAFGTYLAVKAIASALYGKEMYFREDIGEIYSRVSEKYVTEEQALEELVGEIFEESV